METRPLMLDVDTGVDDAAAIALAIGLKANLVAISTVAGNVPIDASTENTRRVLSLLGREDVPVYRGASRPLTATYQDASHVHGSNGLGGVELPPATAPEGDCTGTEAIIRLAERYAGELTLVMVGPLTNLAIALSLRPGITRQIARLVIMGGAYFYPGNITTFSEFNLYVDPDAAQQVFNAKWEDITAIGLDVTHQTALTRDMWKAIPKDATGAAGLVRAISQRTFGERARSGFLLHDPLAVAVALDSSLITGRCQAVTMELQGNTRGRSSVTGEGNVLVATEVRADVFVRRFCGALNLPYVEDTEGLANAE
jgi:purine nucleosidase